MKSKNKIRKVFSIIISALAIMGMAKITAFAAPTSATTGTLKIEREGATFAAYKVLDPVLKEGNTVYEYSATSEFVDFFKNETYGNYTIEGIREINETKEKEAFATQLEKYVQEKNITGTEFQGGANAKELPLGYYLVLQTGSASTNAYIPNKAVTVSIPESSDNESFNYNLVVTPKDSKPSVDINIVENNKKVDKNDVSIGETVTYELTATVPKYSVNAIEDRIIYYLKSRLSKGLALNEESIEVVGVKGSIETPLVKFTDYEVKVINNNEDASNEILLSFDGKYSTIKYYDSIKVNYNVTLNDNTIIGGEGNLNDVLLGYTNNTTSGEKHETDRIVVKTYTYAVGIQKVDAIDMTDLAGAEFELTNEAGEVVGRYGYASNGAIVISGDNIATDENGRVYFIGLDEGLYKLKETKSPNGYVLLSGTVDFTIRPREGEDGLPTGKFTVYVGGLYIAAIEYFNINGSEAILPKIIIKNKKIFPLPTTGGIGTWMFTIGGSLLMAGSAALFIINKKREQD